MNDGLNLLAGELPLLIGLALFALLIRFNPYKRHFVVQYNGLQYPSAMEKDVAAQSAIGANSYLHDQLILSGIYPDNLSVSQLRAESLQRLGLVEADRVRLVLSEPRKRSERIGIVFGANAIRGKSLLLEKSKVGGILLAHLLESKLEFVVV